MRAMTKKKPKKSNNTIARNKRASFDYQLLDSFEAGVALSGWEVKSLRMGKADIGDTYVLVKDGEAFLHLGGMELILDISGAEAFILEQEFPSEALNLGGEMGNIAAGMSTGAKILNGKVMLVPRRVGS